MCIRHTPSKFTFLCPIDGFITNKTDRAFSALNRTLDMISQDACAFYNQQALVPFAGGVFDNQEGARIASFIGPHHKVAILQNHGLLSVGRLSIDEAAWWQISFESTPLSYDTLQTKIYPVCQCVRKLKYLRTLLYDQAKNSFLQRKRIF